MTPAQLSKRLGIPVEECGTDSPHSIVHAIRIVQLGHRITVAGSADPNNPGLRTSADTADILVSLYRLNPRLRFFLSTELRHGLVAVRFSRQRDKDFLQQDFWILPPTWKIEVPNGKKSFEIFEHLPAHDPNYVTGMDLGNCRARIVTSVPLPGGKSEELFRWADGQSPNEMEPARLPHEWINGLPAVRKAAA